MSDYRAITVAYGDGIGPEIMEAVLYILKEAKAKITIETVEVGEVLYNKGFSSGISDETWESLKRTKILLKAPITTPQGGGYKSLNVTLRKRLGLFANIRSSVSYHPFIETNYHNMDLVIIRENEEDLYAGIEYRQTHNMYKSLKLISRLGSEKIIRYGFEYAIKNNRKKVTCMSKDNIMKFSDGIFHKVFDEISKEYPSIKTEHYIIDIGTAKLATSPEIFDVIVTSNLYGDIISDVTAEISGSVGLAGSSNIGRNYALFEAIHGSAPMIAGKNIANPSGLLNAAIMMLVHIGQGSIAATIENAWKATIESGVHTVDIFDASKSLKKVSTKEFAEEVVKNLGKVPQKLIKASYSDTKEQSSEDKKIYIDTSEAKELVGVDVFFSMKESSPNKISEILKQLQFGEIQLTTISSMGLKVWPTESNDEIISDHWCARFMHKDSASKISHKDISNLLLAFTEKNIDFINIENLYSFNKIRGYSLAQGE